MSELQQVNSAAIVRPDSTLGGHRPEVVADASPFIPMGAHSNSRVISAATTLTGPAGSTRVALSCTGQNVLFTLDGSTPSPTNGFPILKDQPAIVVPVPSGVTLKVIQAAATAVLQEQWGQ